MALERDAGLEVERGSSAVDAARRELDRVVLPLEVRVRPATADDLAALEWFGMFMPHREIIHDAFARQERGENLMLVAEMNGFPIGQAWVDLAVRASEGAGLLWAVRVYPFLQGLGLGSLLLAAAEDALRERGFRWAEIGVEKDNPAASRLYERLGYRFHRDLLEEFAYTDTDGRRVVVPVDQWMLRKELGGG